MKKIVASLLLLSALGAEADHYTYRVSDKPVILKDASKQLSASAREFLSKKLKEINSKSNCNNVSEKELYGELQEIFANHSKGKLVKDVLYTDKYPVIKIPLNESIYKPWSLLNGFLLGRKKAAESPLALAPLIKVGDVVVGTDKLEHLFGMGFQYFDRHYLRGHDLKRVLKRGIFFEKTILGGNILATGVFAYADLAANFNGMRFWNHMLQKRDDVLGKEHNIGPYLKCSEGKFEQIKEIDFSIYLDLGSDESVNCSKFASKKGLEKYNEYLASVNMTCPRRPSFLEDLRMKYDIPTQGDRKNRPLSHWILNLDGNGKVSYLNEF